MQNVAALFVEAAAPEKRCSEGIVNILKAAVEEIYTGGLAKVTLNLRGGVKASISQNSKGEINVERTETKKQKQNRGADACDRKRDMRVIPESRESKATDSDFDGTDLQE